MPVPLSGYTLLTSDDLYLFNEGSHFALHEKLGAIPCINDGVPGVHFAVWAPSARQVSVIADFNGWNRGSTQLHPQGNSGIWASFVPQVPTGTCYKYAIETQSGSWLEKADPCGAGAEVRPRTGSVVTDLSTHVWRDAAWMAKRANYDVNRAPMSIYEVHLGSWMRNPDGSWLGYYDAARKLAEYAQRMGYTHIELLPIMEYPFDGSWGYQTVGLYAPTSRFGTPHDFMGFVDYLHQAGIGIILDWVPSHFAVDGHGLALFDGTHLYEHSDPRQGYHPDWGSYIFNYGRHEVRSFLISSAMSWLERYHIDGLRVDAVASMLYLDYSRKDGEWIPNAYGGRENIDAIVVLRRLNEEVHRRHRGVVVIAEESTAWPMVSRPTDMGGLGFNMKWDMGWMHDTLKYMSQDPVHRRYHHNMLTFRSIYSFSENFTLALSHDEVVHGKGSLLAKMPGDRWQQFANLRLLYGYMYAQSGKKLLFMGGEIAQWREWGYERELDWYLLDDPMHRGVQQLVSDLNHLHVTEPALHQLDFDPWGFHWIACDDADQSVVSILRRGHEGTRNVVVVGNFTPVPRYHYRIGVPAHGNWQIICNSDDTKYGGSGAMTHLVSEAVPCHGMPASVVLTLPPLATVYLAPAE
ncbi:MAG: 1,4-alpha-glucan branching protein GlgB [Chloroflexi bacterium]|nr:1,4-alpha-glucan branching protein GlgB [Chloroflexota bacterium]